MMALISISFFSDLDVSSQTRCVSFPHATRPALHMDIRKAMQSKEFFACYQTPDGGTIALDRQGVTVCI